MSWNTEDKLEIDNFVPSSSSSSAKILSIGNSNKTDLRVKGDPKGSSFKPPILPNASFITGTIWLEQIRRQTIGSW